MKNKRILITGSTSGIGRASAKELAKMGANIVLVSRNEEKLKTQVEELKKATNNESIDYIQGDLSSLADIRKVAEIYRNRYTELDVLLNNAGLIVPDHRTTTDGYEYTFALNHLGYFLLTGLLLDLLKKSSTARIVSVSSSAHKAGKINFNDINFEKGYNSFAAYSQSKLANVLFTYELAEKLKNTNITVNCLHPGVVNTNFGNDYKGGLKLIMSMLKPLLITADKGAETSIFLASSPKVKTVAW